MKYWHSPRWKISYSKGAAQNCIEPSLPFALIGSHEACTLALREPRLPSAVYLACSFDDGIEIWPLCAISFPRWGVFPQQDELLIGRSAITFIQEDEDQPPDSSSAESDSSIDHGNINVTEQQQRYPKVVLTMDGESRTKTLRRRVTILGSRHPCTFRVHGLRLSPYDHAIVTVDDSVWLIDLKCPEGMTQEKWVTQLVPNGEAVAIGNMQVQLQATDEATDNITSELGNEINPVRSEAGESMLLRVRKTSKNPRANSGAKFAPLELIRDQLVEENHDRSLKEDDDELATRITDRLVSIQQRKTLRRRLVATVAYSSAFLVAIFSISWIVVRLLIPAFVDAG